MDRKARKYLYDVRQACERIAAFTRGRTFEEYASDDMLRSAVERQFEIVGEALNGLARIDPPTVGGSSRSATSSSTATPTWTIALSRVVGHG